MKKFNIVLIVAIIHGLIYVFITPPWQHYDEPGHFEYVWLIANRLKLPKVGDFDQNMRLAVGKSLLDSSFFKQEPPNLTDPSKPIWIGISQLPDLPLYYVIESIPFHLLKGTSVNLQLYAGRIVSLLFLLLTIFSAYKLTQELTPVDHPVQWMVPLFLSMLPAFVEFMTSLNNIVAAIALLSLWLLVAVKLIKKFSLKSLIFLLLLTAACLLTQQIVYPVLLYLPIVFLLSVFPGRYKYIVWILTAVIALISIFIVFSWGDAAFWMRANYQDFHTRKLIQENGNDVSTLVGKIYPDTTWGLKYPSWNSGFFQLVPSEQRDHLRGKTVTIGAWVWSDQNISGYGPGLNSLLQFQDSWLGFKQVSLDKNPRFIASVVQIPEQQDQLQIWLRATSLENQNAIISFSGVILAEGVWPTDTGPLFIDKDGTSGMWGDKPFTNLVRNAQFQHTWPYLRPQIFRLISSKIDDLKPFHISSFLSVFMDISGTAWYTEATGSFMFKTFWAEFGWGQVPLLNNGTWFRPYLLLLIITLLGILGALSTGYGFVKSYKNEYAILAFVTVVSVIVAVLYGVYTMGGALRYRPFIPTARYIFPVILPISLFLVIGWHGLIEWITEKIKLPPRFTSFLFSGFLICLDLFSILSVITFYNKM